MTEKNKEVIIIVLFYGKIHRNYIYEADNTISTHKLNFFME